MSRGGNAGSGSGGGTERAASIGQSRDETIAARLLNAGNGRLNAGFVSNTCFTVIDWTIHKFADLASALRSAQEVRDEVSREGYQGNVEYLRFIDVLLPVILKVLSEGQPVLWTCPPEVRTRLLNEPPNKHPHGQEALHNGLRYLLLETLHRLVHHDPLQQHVSSIMNLLLKLMETENEENAILALKVIIDLHRSYKDHIGSTASGFLELVKQAYQNMHEVVLKAFGDEKGQGISTDEDEDPNSVTVNTPHTASISVEAGTPGSLPAATPGPLQTSAPPLSARSITSTGNAFQAESPLIRRLPLGMKSLKLLAECPIAVVFLFQTYRDIVPNELRAFVPLVFSVSVCLPSSQ